MSKSIVLCLCLPVLLLSSEFVGGTTPSAPNPIKIVILGDSLAEGYGVSREAAFPALVQELAKKAGKNWQVVNAGISGSTTASAPSRMNWQLKQKPDLIVLALGANDGLRGVPVATAEANLAAALTAAQTAKTRCLLVGMKMPPNYGTSYTKDFAAMYTRLAKRFKIPLLPFLLEGVAGRATLNLADGIHPNEKGHVLLADTVFKKIQEVL